VPSDQFAVLPAGTIRTVGAKVYIPTVDGRDGLARTAVMAIGGDGRPGPTAAGNLHRHAASPELSGRTTGKIRLSEPHVRLPDGIVSLLSETRCVYWRVGDLNP
jgi:hypothetical protein